MDEKQICAIWKTEALVSEKGRGLIVDSLRAGGKYQITNSVKESILKNFKEDDDKVKLTDWLIEERQAGNKVPKINIKILKHVKDRRKKAMSERIKSLMSYIAKKFEVHGLLQVQHLELQRMLTAYSSSKEFEEMYGCLRYCASKEYLEERGIDLLCYAMTVEGKIYAEEISKEDKQKHQCFVAMWFNKETDDAYEKAIVPAIIDAGYKPYRVDKDHHNGKIDDLIIAEIRNSRFIIADFTSKPKEPRGGVYFEAGLAYGLDIPVIWTCQQKLIKHIHFDTRQFRHIGWQKNRLRSFYNRLYYSIRANIGRSEDAKGKGAFFKEQ